MGYNSGSKGLQNHLTMMRYNIFTENIGVVKLLGTGNWTDASLPKCVLYIVPVIETFHIKVEQPHDTTEMLKFAKLAEINFT